MTQDLPVALKDIVLDQNQPADRVDSPSAAAYPVTCGNLLNWSLLLSAVQTLNEGEARL